MSHVSTLDFETMHRRCYRRIVAFARQLCKNRDDAEDIAQETFVRAYSAFHTFNRDGAIENWLMRIAYNVFLDWRRYVDRRVRLLPESELGDDFHLESVVDPRTASGSANGLDIAHDVNHAMETLSPLETRIFRLATFDQLTSAEIADQLGMSGSAVRKHLGKARREVQMRLPKETTLTA